MSGRGPFSGLERPKGVGNRLTRAEEEMLLEVKLKDVRSAMAREKAMRDGVLGTMERGGGSIWQSSKPEALRVRNSNSGRAGMRLPKMEESEGAARKAAEQIASGTGLNMARTLSAGTRRKLEPLAKEHEELRDSISREGGFSRDSSGLRDSFSASTTPRVTVEHVVVRTPRGTEIVQPPGGFVPQPPPRTPAGGNVDPKDLEELPGGVDVLAGAAVERGVAGKRDGAEVLVMPGSDGAGSSGSGGGGQGGGALLAGDFNEGDSHASFAEALKEWRSGGKANDPERPTTASLATMEVQTEPPRRMTDRPSTARPGTARAGASYFERLMAKNTSRLAGKDAAKELERAKAEGRRPGTASASRPSTAQTRGADNGTATIAAAS